MLMQLFHPASVLIGRWYSPQADFQVALCGEHLRLRGMAAGGGMLGVCVAAAWYDGNASDRCTAGCEPDALWGWLQCIVAL